MEPTKIVTGKVRFCYANVFEPTAMNDGDTPKYNICILIPKSDEKTISEIPALPGIGIKPVTIWWKFE